MNNRITETSKELAEQSRYSCWELAKYLFTANTGAAAGLLLLLRSSPGNCPLLISFCFFCAGAFCVLVSIFFGTSHAVEVSTGFQKDFLSGATENEIITQHNKRFNHPKLAIIPIGAWLSFCFLFVGGIIAAFALFNGKIPASEQKPNPMINVVITNAPTFGLTITSASPVYFSQPVTNMVRPH
jgi:hypothetical protein